MQEQRDKHRNDMLYFSIIILYVHDMSINYWFYIMFPASQCYIMLACHPLNIMSE